MRYALNHDELVGGFVEQMIPSLRERGLGKCRTIGVLNNDNELIAGIAYSNYMPEAGIIELAIAALPGSGWLCGSTIRIMAEYPFDQLGCQMVIHRTPASSQHILRMLAVAGYTHILIPRLFGRGADGVISTLTVEDWRAHKLYRRYGRPFPKAEQTQEAA